MNSYEVTDLKTGTMRRFDTLADARASIGYDRLTDWHIWAVPDGSIEDAVLIDSGRASV